MKSVLWFSSLISLLAAQGVGLTFKQVSYIPTGLVWGYGYLKGIDINHDGYEDLIFGSRITGDSSRVTYYGHRPYNRYVLQDSIHSPPSYVWDIGNLDGDSLLDLVTQAADSAGVGKIGFRIFEPLDYWSFPKALVWSWRYEWVGNQAQPMYITDLDRDGLKEILTADNNVVYVFENRGDNQYLRVFTDTTWLSYPASSFAFGDFDGDSQEEFVRGSIQPPPSLYLYECIGNDRYRLNWMDTLPIYNVSDMISGPDLDGDGKLEFIFGDNHRGASGLTGSLWVYEAISNNQYEISYTDSVTGLNDRGVYAVHSDCGDVDRDGKPELVLT